MTLVIAAVLEALPKTPDNAPMRKLLTAALKRAEDKTYTPGSSEGQRHKHSAVKLIGELGALTNQAVKK